MKSLIAIARTTIRSALRSHVVHAVLFFLLLAIFILPLTIKGDGTAEGLIKVSLTYALNTVGFLLAVVTLWLGCTMITDDIEEYQAHLVLSKPVSRLTFWCGKLLGILVMQGALLIVAATAIYGITMWRFNAGNFTEAERSAIRDELLVGRSFLEPDPLPVREMVLEEYQRRLAAGYEKPEHMTDEMVFNTLRRDIMGKLEEVPWGYVRSPWIFSSLPDLQEGDVIQLRFRFYSGSASSKDQRMVRGRWWAFDQAAGQPVPLNVTQYMGGRWHHLDINREFLQQQREFAIAFENLDMFGQPVVFQLADGPQLMLPATSFLMNYARVILLIFMQIVFLGILGCTCGALLSSPVALFLAFSYVTFGLVLLAMEPGSQDDVVVPQGFFSRSLFMFRNLVKHAIVSINEFNYVDYLSRGHLIPMSRILWLCAVILLLHGGLITLFGIFFFNRRELGKVIRR